MKTQLTLLSTLLLSIALTACGGGGSSNSNTNNTNPNPNTNNNNSGNTTNNTTKTFSDTATWTVNSSTPAVVCYDFDKKMEIGCDTTTWDLKFDNSNGRTPSFYSNGGVSGSGKGGALGLFDWSELKAYTTATIEPVSKQDISRRYTPDMASGIFASQSWYEYNSTNHQLQPNNRVYLITTDSTNPATASSVQMPIFAVQIINYYNETGTSGYPTLRWIDTAMPNDVKTKQFDASKSTTYINLKTGETTNQDGDWHIAFNRYNVQLNGGISGKGKVAGLLAKTPAGYYDTENKAIGEKFTKDNREESKADLTNVSAYNLPANMNARQWVSDSKNSVLNPAYTGSFPNPLDFGWYTYNPNGHKISAKAEDVSKGALIRSGEGDSYARMRVTDIVYADATARMPTSWKIEFDIQPK